MTQALTCLVPLSLVFNHEWAGLFRTGRCMESAKQDSLLSLSLAPTWMLRSSSKHLQVELLPSLSLGCECKSQPMPFRETTPAASNFSVSSLGHGPTRPAFAVRGAYNASRSGTPAGPGKSGLWRQPCLRTIISTSSSAWTSHFQYQSLG